MNVVKELQRINQREIESGLEDKASWHANYADSAYIYVGGLDYRLTEGDVITIFSQYGEPVDVHLPRDKKTGKSHGFAFLAYEDQRSTNLAVDNLNGSKLLGRTLRVDHKKHYKPPEEEIEIMQADAEEKAKVKKQKDITETAAAAAAAARSYPHLQKTFNDEYGASIVKKVSQPTTDIKRLDPDELWEKQLTQSLSAFDKQEKQAKKEKKAKKKEEKKKKKELKKAKKEMKKGQDDKDDSKSSDSSSDENEGSKRKISDFIDQEYKKNTDNGKSSSKPEEEKPRRSRSRERKERSRSRDRARERSRSRERDRNKGRDFYDKDKERDRGERDRDRDRGGDRSGERRRSRSRDRDRRREYEDRGRRRSRSRSRDRRN